MVRRGFKKIKIYMSDKDERNLLKNIVISFLIKGISLLISTFSLPLYIRFFNDNEVLGIWYTVLSLLSWIAICDMGLSNGMRNRLTSFLAEKKYSQAKVCVSSTYCVLTAIIVPVSILISCVIVLIDVNNSFNISSDVINPNVLRVILMILVLGVGLNFIVKTINTIMYALQAPAINNVTALITSSLPLLFVLLYNGENIETNLILLAIVHIIAMNLPPIIASIIVFSHPKIKQISPKLKLFNSIDAKKTFSLGIRFFGAQLLFMFLMSTNEIFITKLYAATEVVNYSVYYKIFMIVGSLFMLALTPLWSKVTKDLTQKKYDKLLKTNKVLYCIAGIATIAEFCLVVILQPIVNIWLQDKTIIVDYKIAIVFALFGSAYIFNIVLTTIANGVGKLKTQIVFYGIGSGLKIPICIFLKSIGIGWHGIILYNNIVLIIFCVFQAMWVNKTIKQLTNNIEK